MADLVKREPWRFVLFMGLTMGLYSFYVVPQLGLGVNRLTGKVRFRFRYVLVAGILTLGIGLSVCEVWYAYVLESNPGYAGGKWKTRYLFRYVLALNILSWALVFVPTGLAFAGSFAFGVLATLMIQNEVNRYLETEKNTCR